MSDRVPPRVRRNNLVTLVLLILFALGLCAFVLISMRIHAQRHAANPDATGLSIPFGVRRLDAAFLPDTDRSRAQTRKRRQAAALPSLRFAA